MFWDILKKHNKLIGIIGCTLTMLSYLLLLLIGTAVLRIEFDFVTHALIPALISKFFVFFWVLYYAFSREYDNASRIFAKNLLVFLVANIFITFFDYEMDYFFLVQSVTSLLLLILTTLLIGQRRFAIRSKTYAASLRVINVILAMCMAGFSILILTSFVTEYVYLFTATVISQIFMIIAICSVSSVEKKFKEALEAGKNDSEEEEFSD